MSDPMDRVSQHLATSSTMVRPVAELLEEVAGFVRRFVSFQNEHQSTATALWIAHCYAIGAAHAAAYLRITSAVEESGKTTLLECLDLLLGDHGINAVSISPAAVFRTRDKLGPVALLLDEVDNTLRDRKDDGGRDLLALVNAGYRRSAAVIRTTGQNHETRRFAAFGPAAIAGIGSLHPTTESRCISIELERKVRGSGERWIPFLVEAEARTLGDALERWASEETLNRLRSARPFIPAELRDRHAEAWWGLFAIADEAGIPWSSVSRTAALALHCDRDAAAGASLGVLLLDHIRRAFEEAGADRLGSAEMIGRLVQNEEGPWGRFWGAEVRRDGPPRAAATDLARKLRVFRRPGGDPLKPRTIRLPDGTTPRGYLREDFETAFERYLSPPEGGATDATNATPLASPVAPVASVAGGSDDDRRAAIARERRRGLSDEDIGGLFNAQSRSFPTPPVGFTRWTGHAVRVAMGESPETDETAARSRLREPLGTRSSGGDAG